MVRPSYVLGGRGMRIVLDEQMLRQYVDAAVEISPDRPLLIDKFLDHAIEAEADAIADGTTAFVPAVMQHIEYAGIHSGDSACVIPPVLLPKEHVDTIIDYTKRIAEAFKVCGLMNIQYAICGGKVYILEANPRASRTVPLVSKVCNTSMARIATEIVLGKRLDECGLERKNIPYYGVKEAVFPFTMYPEVDPVLGPEMRSTGEVLGLADTAGMAFFKSQEAAKQPLPLEGTVLVTVSNRDKEDVLDAVKGFRDLGFKIRATGGTTRFLQENGIEAESILKVHQGRPNIVDAIMNGEIQFVINTPAGKKSEYDDSYIRKTAIRYGVSYITTTAAASAAVEGIRQRRNGAYTVKSLQDYHRDIG